MKSFKGDGFTIIETMLFLGISGLLIMGVLVGTGVSINIQRYRDSVVSLQSVLQQQFNSVSNPINTRNNSWSCSSGGPVESGGQFIGQSDCVILGKLIRSSDGKKLTINDVIGYSNDGTAVNDIDILKQYKPKVFDSSIETYDIDWGSTLNPVKSNNPMNFSIFIVKSPLSGAVRTFINDNKSIFDSEIESIINESNLEKDLKICLNSNGFFNGNKMAVTINANASSASSVETLGDNSGC